MIPESILDTEIIATDKYLYRHVVIKKGNDTDRKRYRLVVIQTGGDRDR